jgi:hypothetical protein
VIDIVEISAADTYALRRIVLRNDDAGTSVMFPEDDDPGAFHLGARNDLGELVAISTWVPRQCPEFPGAKAIQLRGMATTIGLQGTGIGGSLFERGVARCAAAGYELLWARARDAALGFYSTHGCRVVGEGFIDVVTSLPHHVIVRDLT